MKHILTTGFIIGTLDGLAACLNAMLRGRDPMKVFVFISSGIFGREAFTAGDGMIAWGILFHYFIATIWTALFFRIYPKVAFLAKNRLVSAMSFGLVVWLVMNIVVLPLSRVPPLKMTFTNAIEGIFILILCVGLPAVISAQRHFRKGSSQESTPSG